MYIKMIVLFLNKTMYFHKDTTAERRIKIYPTFVSELCFQHFLYFFANIKLLEE